jgi:hypothetical protein
MAVDVVGMTGEVGAYMQLAVPRLEQWSTARFLWLMEARAKWRVKRGKDKVPVIDDMPPIRVRRSKPGGR